MDNNADQSPKGRRSFVVAAWASPFSAIVISLVLWAWFANHIGTRGERPSAVLIFYLVLLGVSALGGLAGVISLFGIRSWRNAMVIVPGALVGLGISGCNAFVCLMSYALEGRNLGG